MKENTTIPAISACVTSILMILVASAYVTGYFVLGDTRDAMLPSGTRQVRRCFKSEWLVSAYQPIAKIESVVTGVNVWVGQIVFHDEIGGCLEYNGDPFYTVPDDIVLHYGLQRMSSDEFDALFPSDDGPDDDECE